MNELIQQTGAIVTKAKEWLKPVGFTRGASNRRCLTIILYFCRRNIEGIGLLRYQKKYISHCQYHSKNEST
jgi:hypothetical protein